MNAVEYAPDVNHVPDTSDISNADYVSAVEKIKRSANKPTLSREQEVDLFIKIEDGDDEAREIMIESNLRLVIAIAVKYQDRGVPLEDLIQEGVIGLIRAVERFDYRLGNKFGTFAIWEIKSALGRACNKYANLIRLPDHLCVKGNRISSAVSHLRQELQREPTEQEIADEIGISVEQLESIMVARTDVQSMDTPIGSEEDESTISDTIQDTSSASDVTEQLSRNDLVERLFEDATQNENLTANEAVMIKLHFGLTGNPLNFPEIGNIIGLTREAVRVAVKRGLAKMQKSYESLQ